MRLFNKYKQEEINALGYYSKKQVLIIALISTIIPTLLYIGGTTAFVIPKESLAFMDNYFWIVVA